MSDVGVIPYHGGGTERQRGEAVAWLRGAITARLVRAREAADGDSGEWFVGDKWNVCRAEDDARHDEDYRGAEHRLVVYGNMKVQSEHIAANDPQQVIADCEADLAMVELCERVIRDDDGHGYWSDGWAGLGVAKLVVAFIASAYRHHPGYAEHWGDGNG